MHLEPDGSIRIYFTVEDVRQKLRKGKQRSVAVLRELEKQKEKAHDYAR